MSKIILLDSGPLGLIIHPNVSSINLECNLWMQEQLINGMYVMVPEIADYEIRRELLRIGSGRAVGKLDNLKSIVGFAPITSQVMLRAAGFWAQARNIGKPTANDAALDGDMILSGHAAVLSDHGHDVVIATTNTKHLSMFANASLWKDIG